MGRHGAAPAQDETAATESGSWSRLRRRRACAAHPGSAHSPTSDSREQGEARVRALRNPEAGDLVRDAGTSTSFAPAHGATAIASAATPETRSTGPAESTGSQPRPPPGHAGSAAAASLKDTQLVAKHSVLDLQRRHRRTPDDQPREPPQRQADEEQEHRPILWNSRRHRPETIRQAPNRDFRPLQATSPAGAGCPVRRRTSRQRSRV